MVAIYDLTARQLLNAELIYDAAKPYGRDAVMAALMTAGDESSYLRYANNGKSTRTDVPQWAKDLAATSLDYPHDAVAGEAWTTADSVGLYQQRPMFNYGTVAALMDPAESTIIFLTGNAAHTTRAFMDAPADMTLAQRCQWTQGSEFPTGENYAPFETVAAQLIERFGEVDAPTSPTPTGTGPVGLLDWITMSVTPEQQSELDAQWDKIAAKVNSVVIDLLRAPEFRTPTAEQVAVAVWATQFAGIAAPIYTTEIDRKVNALSEKLDAFIESQKKA